MPTLLGRAICCCTTGIPRFRLRTPDPLMECSESESECNRKIAGTSRPSDGDSMRRVGASARPQPAPAPKPLDAWFFEAQVLGCTCPRSVGLVASRRTNLRRNRGGLLLRMRRVGPVCGSGLQGGCAPAGHAAGSCNEALEWALEWITRPTAWAHMYAHPAVIRQDMVGRSCQKTDRMSSMFGSGVQ